MKSVTTIMFRLRRHYQRDVKKVIIFGSYSRETILPRRIDERSDVDLMVLFADSESKPQTYLDRLRRFVETSYTSSEEHQSNPTVVLQLNHVSFELVPAIKTWFGGLQIPAPASDFQDWIETNPTEFNLELQDKNKQTGFNMKPLIRLMKYWNATNGYVFPSYELERKLVSQWFWRKQTLRDYFYAAFESLDLGWGAANWRQECLERTQKTVLKVKEYERRGAPDAAEMELKKLLPVFW